MQKHEREVKELNDVAKAKLESTLDKMKNEHEASIKSISENNRKRIEDIESSSSRKISDLEESHKNGMSSLIRKHDSAISEQKSKFDQVSKQKEGEIASLQANLNELSKEKQIVDDHLRNSLDEIEKYKKLILDLESRMQGYEDEARKAKEKYDKLTTDLINEYDTKKQTLEKVYVDKTEAFKKQQIEEFRKVKEEFQEVMKIMEKKNRTVIEKFQELKDVFDKRPSREEDLENIANLMEEIKRSEKIIRNFEGKMEYYKNELNIREDNYNNKFNYKPNVGNYDPLKGRDQVSQQLNNNTNNLQRRKSEKKQTLAAVNKLKSMNSSEKASLGGLLAGSNSQIK